MNTQMLTTSSSNSLSPPAEAYANKLIHLSKLLRGAMRGPDSCNFRDLTIEYAIEILAMFSMGRFGTRYEASIEGKDPWASPSVMNRIYSKPYHAGEAVSH